MHASARRSRALLACFVALGTLLASACSSGDDSEPPEGAGPNGTVRFGIEEYPSAWEPGTDNGYAWVRVPYETLVARSGDDATAVEPLLATEWDVQPDSITFTLRDDVTFHDGTPFNAEAAKFNLEYVRDQAGPFSAALQVVESFETPDETTLVLNLSAPSQSLLTTLTGRGGVMASPQAIEDGTIKDHPVGTGPWAYDEELNIPGTEIGFTLYDGYWDLENVGAGQIVLVAIDDTDARLDALMTGEVDMADVNLAQAEQAEAAGLELVTFPGIHYSLMMFDRGPGGVVEDPAVRRAICQSIDTVGLAALGGDGFLTATNQRFQEGEYGHSSEIPAPEYDPDAAGPTLEGVSGLGMLAYEQNQPFAEAIAGGLAEVDVELDVEVVTASEYFTGWYDGTRALGLGDNTELTPEEWYRTWFAADAPNNPSGAESPELAAAAELALAEPDLATAEPLWVEVMDLVHEEALQCNNLIINQAIGWMPDRVDGITAVDWEASSVVFKTLTTED